MMFAKVFKTFSSIEAQLTASRLEAAGFHPDVLGELSSGYSMGMGVTNTIIVQVPSEEEAEALAFLAKQEGEGSDNETGQEKSDT